MKIMASVPVRKVQLVGASTFECEWIECEVVGLARWRADRHRPRYYYQAFVLKPVELHPEAPNGAAYIDAALFQVNVCRRKNSRWKPPVFPAGKGHVWLKDGYGTR
ncbi:hypothetical protein SAMN05421829_108149 [Aromatoleum tolulyticum]|uniref:Uncharacterized protein n=1 Tax=Aromatoleum tolulyticum TaxID=34027 RepID=A0A1N6X0V5_9RHOO|nr:hypothetical protein [Aromatoleum tolulyticum]SIQ95979.1 hypothetical protein SAMN05421829_108149 [Aromatoleum tolulyticum]